MSKAPLRWRGFGVRSNMKEKEKGKGNPFAGVLRPDEEILWLYKRLPLHFGSHLKQYALTSLVGLLAVSVIFGLFVFVIMMIYSAFAGFLFPWLPALGLSFIAALVIVWIILFPILLIAYPFDWWQEQHSHRVYAVTSQRLLSYKNG